MKPMLPALIVVSLIVPAIAADDYDPLKVANIKAVRTVELTLTDAARDRELPLRAYLPTDAKPAPVVLFSHGLGGSREGSEFLGKHWAARGYVAVILQHPGSDDSVWKDVPPLRRMAAMRDAASARNYLLRVKDVSVVLDGLTQWNADAKHALHARLDLSRVGMSGHSFGAQTTQGVAGQSAPLIGQRATDPRIKAAVVLSPSTPRRGDAKEAFGDVKIPWLLMTGTKDTSPIGGQTVESRLAVYPALPASIDKYELVLHDGEHSAFTERALPGDVEARNPNHHRLINSLSTAFWDAHLRNDAAAKAWLQGDAARKLLEAKDRWQVHAAGR